MSKQCKHRCYKRGYAFRPSCHLLPNILHLKIVRSVEALRFDRFVLAYTINTDSSFVVIVLLMITVLVAIHSGNIVNAICSHIVHEPGLEIKTRFLLPFKISMGCALIIYLKKNANQLAFFNWHCLLFWVRTLSYLFVFYNFQIHA